MNHALLIAEQVVGEIRVLLQRLSNAGNISVAEDAHAAPKKALLFSVPSNGLDLQKLDNGLGHG